MTALLCCSAFDDHSFLSPENTQKFLSRDPEGPAITGMTGLRFPAPALAPSEGPAPPRLLLSRQGSRALVEPVTSAAGRHPLSLSQRGLPVNHGMLN